MVGGHGGGSQGLHRDDRVFGANMGQMQVPVTLLLVSLVVILTAIVHFWGCKLGTCLSSAGDPLAHWPLHDVMGCVGVCGVPALQKSGNRRRCCRAAVVRVLVGRRRIFGRRHCHGRHCRVSAIERSREVPGRVPR